MDFGTAMGVFITLAVVLLVLFCLVTKYFQYRMNKMAEQQGQEFSQVDEITNNSDEDIQGQYEQFLQKRKQKKQSELNAKKNREQAYLFEQTQVEEPIKDSKDPMYNVSMLRKRLDGQVVLPSQPTGRSVPSVRSFRPQRLQTGRSNLSSQRPLAPIGISKTPVQPLTKHEYISKLVGYNQEGIFILDVGVVSLTKTNGKIKEKKLGNTIIVNPNDVAFQDQLQVLGFQLKQYSCMKYKTIAEIPYMQENQQYPVSKLKTTESKQEIDFSQYYMLKDRIQSSIE